MKIPRVLVWIATICLAVSIGQSGRLDAQSNPKLTIIHPTPNEAIHGTYAFAASTDEADGLASIEFKVGSKRLGISTNPRSPNVSWNTGYASDGSYTLTVTGRNPAGQVTSSVERAFTINNHGNALEVTSPDLGKTLTGMVSLTVRGSDHQYYPATWLINVDGQNVRTIWTDNLGQKGITVTGGLDTTAYSNGTHELYIGMHSDFWPEGKQQSKSWYNWRGGFARIVSFENGHVLMEIAASYLHVYLTPAGKTSLACRRLYTDDSSAPCVAPAYASSDSGVVAVSASGALTAGAKAGFATITVTDSGKSTEVYVWVKRNLNVPHFSGSGQILNSYTSGRSLFVVAPFVLTSSSLSRNPRLVSLVKQAGVNTVSEGFYTNPRNLKYNYLDWRRHYNSSNATDWEFARSHDFHILATGDEVCRRIGGEAWWTLNWPSGKVAVQYAMQKLAASGVAVGVDMVDEVSSLWGGTPTPPGRVGGPNSFTSVSCAGGTCTVLWPNNPVKPSRNPSGTSFALTGSHNSGLNTPAGQMFSASNIRADSFDFTPAAPVNGNFTAANDPNLEFLWWAGKMSGCPSQPCDPPVPNDALLQITKWLHGAHPGVPVSWPPLGQSAPSIVANWMGPNSISDYASHYWVPLSLRHTYTWDQGIQELGSWMCQAFYQRQPVVMLDRPQLLLESISGPFYTKQTLGAAYYTPPADTLEQPGVSGPAITGTMMTAAALGAAGVRPYLFEEPANLASRAAAPVGTTLQTGANPIAEDPIIQENWRAMGYAATALTGVLSPYLLGTALNSPAYGRNIVTAARQGSSGRMLMIVNDNDWQRTVMVDFRPFRYGARITRYRIGADGITQGDASNAGGETITLDPGETAAYLFAH